MNRLSARLLTAIAFCATTAVGAKVRADCLDPCGSALCGGAHDVVVEGTLSAEGNAVVVERILRSVGMSVMVGQQIRFRDQSMAQEVSYQSRKVVAYLDPPSSLGSQMPAVGQAMPIAADGKVQCPPRSSGSVAAGQGFTSVTLVEALELEQTQCMARAEAAGYRSPKCDDTPGVGCAIGSRAHRGRTGGDTIVAFLIIVAVAGRQLFIRSRTVSRPSRRNLYKLASEDRLEDA